MRVTLATMRAIAAFDLRSEVARPVALATAGTFALTVLVVLHLALSGDAAPTGRVLAGSLWIVLLFSGLLAATRPITVEREDNSVDRLLLAVGDRSAVYFGKAVAAFAGIAVLHVAVIAAWGLLFGVDLAPGSAAALVGIVVLADAGFALAATLVAMLTLHARARDLLMTAMFLPLVVPAVIAGVLATLGILGAAGAEIGQAAGFLALYALTLICIGIAAVPEAVVE
jgi:heme exporter protein B